MKIAHVISSCQAAGAELFTKSLVKKMIIEKNVDEIEVWVMMKVNELSPNNKDKINYESDFISDLEKHNIKVKFIDKKLKKGWYKTKRKIRELYNSFKPNIVHSHHETVAFHVCRSLSQYNVKLIETIHSNFIEYPLLHKLFLKKRLSYIAISNKVGNLIEEKIGVNSNIIYNGIELKNFEFSDRSSFEEVKSIIAVGRLTEVKDHKSLLFAFAELKKKLITNNIKVPKLLLVGDGELKNDLILLSEKLNLIKDIKFLGIQNNISDLLNKSEIYVMSSKLEGLSISLIEALTSGIAIVATDVGSNDEIIQHEKTGILVPKQNHLEMAAAIYRLLEHGELRKKFFQNSKQASKQFDINTCVQNHILMYKEILVKNR